jgi:hypothetical protein
VGDAIVSLLAEMLKPFTAGHTEGLTEADKNEVDTTYIANLVLKTILKYPKMYTFFQS